MPRLGHQQAIRNDAITALLKLYRNDPNFMKDLGELRRPYMPLIERHSKEFLQRLLDPCDTESKTASFPDKERYLVQLQPYFDGLANLTHKWNLRVSWAVVSLFALDILDCCKTKGMPDKLHVTLEEFGSLYPWEPPVPPMTIAVPAWAVVALGRKEVLEEVARRLKEYENQIKAAGLKEYPSALKIHARWWFEHYVKRKSYPELEKRYTQANRETIKRKVWEFSRLVGIKTR